MVQTKKRTLTFQTPKKRTATPLRAQRPAPVRAEAAAPQESIEERLVQAYREENAFLRNLKGDVCLYSKLLGITIEQTGPTISFGIQRDSTTGRKKLEFLLEEKEESYVFTLKEAENCSIPEYFYDVIEFEKKAFPQFFYKAMQSVYETRTNG